MLNFSNTYLIEKHIEECIEGNANTHYYYPGFLSFVAHGANNPRLTWGDLQALKVLYTAFKGRVLNLGFSGHRTQVRVPRWFPLGTPLV